MNKRENPNYADDPSKAENSDSVDEPVEGQACTTVDGRSGYMMSGSWEGLKCIASDE